MEWPNETVLKFLNVYGTEPAIWDMSHPDNKYRNKVHAAWNRILAEMGDKFTVESLKKKKESLMASYRMYVKRMKKSKTSGTRVANSYRPTWFAFAAMDRFLGKGSHLSINSEDTTGEDNGSDLDDAHNEISERGDASRNDDRLQNRECTQSQSPLQTENKTSKQLSTSRIKDENLDRYSHLQNIDDAGVELPSTSTTAKVFKFPVRKKKKLAETDNREIMIQSADSILQSATQKPSVKEKDVSDIFGELVAAKLKEMDERDREICMYRINNVLFEMKLKADIPSLSGTYRQFFQEVPISTSLGHSMSSQPSHSSSDGALRESL